MSKNKYKNNTDHSARPQEDPREGRGQELVQDAPLIEERRPGREDVFEPEIPEGPPLISEESSAADGLRPSAEPRMPSPGGTKSEADPFEEGQDPMRINPEEEALQLRNQAVVGTDRLSDNVDELFELEPAPVEASSAEPSKGFPWWWILLPIVLLALIYALTRM
ncbi:hypothetical protein ABB02_01833 [Clostridiaceae bacterium JG1575]|nr:hypothetical protein ABB02_01833 [Clostridiaceae bacterium JG1575]